MFIAPRPAKCSSPRCSFAGHDTFSQRQTASSSSRCRSLPHAGHVVGITHGCESGRPLAQHRTDDARNDVAGLLDDDLSPSRMSLRAMSSALCSVAIETVVPPTKIGSSTANGVTAPVRPTLTAISFSSVVFCSAGNLNATAQRGNLLVVPSLRRRSSASTLMTTPSVSKPRLARLSAHSRAERHQRVDAGAAFPVRLDRQSPLLQPFERLGMRMSGRTDRLGSPPTS